MKKIVPFLWFDDNAEEAMRFYLSVFKDAKRLGVKRLAGKVVATEFRLCGQEFIALNGGPHFKFTPAISFFVRCKDQKEIDYYWTKLCQGGSPSQCGWLADKFGLSWQIVPAALEELLWNVNPKKKDRVWDALMKMTKIEIAGLRAAAKR